MDGISSTVHPRLRAHRPRVRRPPASSTTSSAALRLKSAGRSCCCGRRTPPKFCTSPQRGGAAAAPPRRGHAPRAVCLVRRGCSPPSFRGRRLLLFNRAGVHAKVAYRVVVAAAPCAEGGRAPCRARAVGGGRWPASPAATTGPAFAAALESRPTPVCLPLRSSLLSSPLLASRRRASFRSQNCSQSLTLACVGYRLQKNHEMVRTMTV